MGVYVNDFKWLHLFFTLDEEKNKRIVNKRKEERSEC